MSLSPRAMVVMLGGAALAGWGVDVAFDGWLGWLLGTWIIFLTGVLLAYLGSEYETCKMPDESW